MMDGKVRVEIAYTDEPMNHPDELITGDRHSWLGATITNDTGKPILDVCVEVLGPLGFSGYAPTADDHPLHQLGLPVDTIDAAASVFVRGLVWVPGNGGPDERPEPAVNITFSDEAGDRWRLTTLGDIELVT